MTKVFRIYKTTNDDIKAQSSYEDRYCSFELERVYTGYNKFSTEEDAVRWLQRNGGLRNTYTILPVWELNWDDIELQLQNV